MSTGLAPVAAPPAVMVTGYPASARLLVPTVHTDVPAQAALGAVVESAVAARVRLPLVENVGVVPVPAPRIVPAGVVPTVAAVANGVDEALTLQPAAVPVASFTVYVSSVTFGSDSNWSAPVIVGVPHPRTGGAVRVKLPPVRLSVPATAQDIPVRVGGVHVAALAVSAVRRTEVPCPPVSRTQAPIPPVSSTEAPRSGISRFLAAPIKVLMSV